MLNKRPKNLNLFTIRFPLPAIVSILHRVSGAFLFLVIPLLLWGLSSSLTWSGFDSLQQGMSNLFVKGAIWIVLAAFCFHMVAGIRHLLTDIHIGISRKGGKTGAMLTFVFSILLILLVGIWLW